MPVRVGKRSYQKNIWEERLIMREVNVISRIKNRVQELEEKREHLSKLIGYLDRLTAQFESASIACPDCDSTGERSGGLECRNCRGLGKVGPLYCEGCGNTIPTTMHHIRIRSSIICPYCGFEIFED
jgi:RecJ-like exonuclease